MSGCLTDDGWVWVKSGWWMDDGGDHDGVGAE